MTEFLQQFINGLSLGAIYALIALGYTMVYGILRFINFAHSDVFMVGAFVGYYATEKWHFAKGTIADGLLVLFLAMTICAGLGMLIERIAYKPFRGASRTWTLLLPVGLVIGVALRLETLGALWHMSDVKLPASVWLKSIAIIALCGGSFAGLGMLIDFFSRRRLQSQSNLTVLITAIGVSLLLQNVGQNQKIGFGPNPRAFPEIFPVHQIHIGGLTFSSSQVIVLTATVFLLAALYVIVHHTRTGTAMRALSFNATAASLLGINNDAVISFTFGLGSALAGAGGILYAMNYPAIDPLMGTLPGLKAFVAAVLGGIGNLPGAALGGVLIGLIETLVVGLGGSTYRDAVAFAVLILILLFKPAGLLGKIEAEKV